MSRLALFNLDDGSSFTAEVELEEDAQGTMRGGSAPAEVIAKSGESFQSALRNVNLAAQAVIDGLRSLPKPPDELTVEFGVKLSAEAGAVIAKASTEANFSISLKWMKPSTKNNEVRTGSGGET